MEQDRYAAEILEFLASAHWRAGLSRAASSPPPFGRPSLTRKKESAGDRTRSRRKSGSCGCAATRAVGVAVARRRVPLVVIPHPTTRTQIDGFNGEQVPHLLRFENAALRIEE